MTGGSALDISVAAGVAEVTILGRGPLNLLDAAGHRELNRVWRKLDDDPAVKVALVTGEGDAFCAGGDLTLYGSSLSDPERIIAGLSSTIELVEEMVAARKPIVSAINGPAVGAGLAVALLADISVVGEGVSINDGHVKIGLPAGDHAALIWPLLCGMAKAKYYLLTGEPLDGREAERIGLVSRCVADDEVLAAARAVAERLARGPQVALAATKRGLNHWLRMGEPAFEFSAAAEALQMLGGDAKEGFAALLEKRPPRFADGGDKPESEA